MENNTAITEEQEARIRNATAELADILSDLGLGSDDNAA